MRSGHWIHKQQPFKCRYESDVVSSMSTNLLLNFLPMMQIDIFLIELSQLYKNDKFENFVFFFKI